METIQCTRQETVESLPVDDDVMEYARPNGDTYTFDTQEVIERLLSGHDTIIDTDYDAVLLLSGNVDLDNQVYRSRIIRALQ